MMELPGAVTVHKIVGRDCRQRPEAEWVEECLLAVETALLRANEGWPKNTDMKIHVVVSVERPQG